MPRKLNEKDKTELLNLIDKALQVAQEAKSKVDHNPKANSRIDFNETITRLAEYREAVENGKPRILKKKQYLKEASRPKYYDQVIYYTVTYFDKRHKHDDIAKPDYKTITEAEIKRLRRKENKGAVLTANELGYTAQAASINAEDNAVNEINNTGLKAQNAKDIDRIMKSRGQKTLDLSFGGNSSLINSLSFAVGGKYQTVVINDFVNYLKNVMKDRQTFAEIEKWVQTTSDGKIFRQIIDEARERSYYKSIKEICQAISLFSTAYLDFKGDMTPGKEELESLRDRAEAEIAGYTEELE